MIRLVEKELKRAAEKSGMNPAHVIRKRKKDVNSLPSKRVEVGFSDASYIYSPDTINVFRTLDKQKKNFRKRIYSVRLDVSADIFSDDENWILDFSNRFSLDLPLKVLDKNGDKVEIMIQKSEFKGFDHNDSDSDNNFQISFLIVFEFIQCVNHEISMIPSADLTPIMNRRINEQN